MRVKQVTLTPQMATRFLEEAKLENRSVSDKVVEAYARDMAAGKWRLTGDTIKISNGNGMIDGQHRCWAVIRSNSPIETMVAYDVEDDARWNVDTQRPRTAGQILQMHGMKGGARMAAVCNAIDSVETGIDLTNRRFTVDDARRVIEKHKGVEWIIEQPHALSSSPCCSSGVLAAFAIFREKYPSLAEETFTTFLAGNYTNPHDPMLTVRNYLFASAQGYKSRNKANQICRRVLTALAYKIQSKTMAKSYDSMEGVSYFMPRTAKRQIKAQEQEAGNGG